MAVNNPEPFNPQARLIEIQQSYAATENKRYFSVVGGIILGLITSLALGIIFGPLAAIAGLCIGGVAGAFLGPMLHSCCTSKSQQPHEIQTIQQKLDNLKNRQEALRERINRL